MSKKNTEILLSKKAILLTAFIEGFLIMGIELIGAKIIAPYYGASFYVWTTVIGITLFSLTVGYFIGGLLSAKFKIKTLIPLLSLLAGIFILLMTVISKNSFHLTLDLPILTGVVISTVLFLFLPLAFIGMLSPVLVLALTKHENTPGNSSGIIYFVSTIAGISSALIYGFWLIPSLEILKNVYTFGLIALSISIFTVFFFKHKTLKYTVLFASFFCFILITKQLNTTVKLPPMNIKIIHQSEGLLGQIKVVDNFDKKSRTLSVNNSSQTKAHFTGRSLFPYVYYVSTFASHKPVGSDVLLAGVGGGSLIYELSLFDFNIEVVELDKRIMEVAKKYFLMPEKKFDVTIDDARHFMRKTKNKYDIIILDMSAGETMPSNVYTVEAFSRMKELLKPNGVIVLHFVSMNSKEGLVSVKSIGKTFQESGFNVSLLNTEPSEIHPSAFVFIASLTNLDFENMEFIIDPALPKPLVPDKNNLLMDIPFNDGYLLTDDRPLLDVIHNPVVMNLRRANIEDIVKPLSKHKLPLYK